MRMRALRSPAFLLAVAILGASAAGFNTAISYLGIYLRKLPIEAPEGRQVQAVPAVTARWERVGQDRQESQEMVEELGTTNYLTRVYQERAAEGGGERRLVDLHLAYYTGMIDTVPHIPDRCMVGGGWQKAADSVSVPVPLSKAGWMEQRAIPETPEGKVFSVRLDSAHSDAPGSRVNLVRGADRLRMRVSQFRAPGSEQSLFVGYFFLTNGTWVDSSDAVRLQAFRLTDDYAYYLKVQISSAQARTAEELAAAAGALLDDLLPEIVRCVPDWVEVEAGRYPAGNPRGAGAGGTGGTGGTGNRG